MNECGIIEIDGNRQRAVLQNTAAKFDSCFFYGWNNIKNNGTERIDAFEEYVNILQSKNKKNEQTKGR